MEPTEETPIEETPAEETPSEGKQQPAGKSRKRLIWWIVGGVLLLALAIGGFEAYRILVTPQNVFSIPTINPALLQSATPTPLVTKGEEAATAAGGATTAAAATTAAPTVKPDITNGSDVLNILLIGIDRRRGETGDEKGTPKSEGTDPHADVMMVVAVNFKEKRVDLISLPRDTFIHAPQIMNGVYKLNASFNVGGGFSAKNGAGFLKVCDAAEYMLGGIPVDYYYAVDFAALVDLVNTIGGVDYNVENRAYVPDGIAGQRHLTGYQVLFYIRNRKAGPDRGDVNRIDRQKKMIIAIFEQMKKKGKLTMMPKLINSAGSNVFTNTNLEQTLALANFATGVSPDHIGMYSMDGGDVVYKERWGWAYAFTDQENRKKLIKQIYGVNVPEQTHYSAKYLDWLLDCGFSGIRYIKTGKQVLDFADTHQVGFSADQQAAYDALKAACASTQAAWDAASLSFASADNHKLTDAKKDLRDHAVKLAKLLDYQDGLKWTYGSHYWNDPGINEVYVDFN